MTDVFHDLDYNLIPGRAVVPWTMVTGPDGNLFIAMDHSYTVRFRPSLVSTASHYYPSLFWLSEGPHQFHSLLPRALS